MEFFSISVLSFVFNNIVWRQLYRKAFLTRGHFQHCEYNLHHDRGRVESSGACVLVECKETEQVSNYNTARLQSLLVVLKIDCTTWKCPRIRRDFPWKSNWQKYPVGKNMWLGRVSNAKSILICKQCTVGKSDLGKLVKIRY